jgi:hypothetical protein
MGSTAGGNWFSVGVVQGSEIGIIENNKLDEMNVHQVQTESESVIIFRMSDDGDGDYGGWVEMMDGGEYVMAMMPGTS